MSSPQIAWTLRFFLAHGNLVAEEIPDWDSHGHRKFSLTNTPG